MSLQSQPIPTQTWLHKLEAESARLVSQAEQLGRGLNVIGPVERVWLSSAIEEISTATEELRAAHEELRVQGDQLADTQGALEQSRREYEELFDFAPDAYLVTDPMGVVIRANHAVSRLVGFARRYTVGKPLAALIHAEATTVFYRKLKEVREAGDDHVHEWETTTRSRRHGPPVDVAVRVAPVRDRSGTVVALRWLLRDVTEQKAAAQAFQRAREEHTRELRMRTVELEAIARMHESGAKMEQAARQRSETAFAGFRHELRERLQEAQDRRRAGDDADETLYQLVQSIERLLAGGTEA